MHRYLCGIAVAAAFALPAQAADMPLKAPPPAAPAWTGFYLGLGIGFRGTVDDPTVTSGTETVAGTPPFDIFGNCLPTAMTAYAGACSSGEPMDGTAFRVAPFWGYNLQIAPRWVVGVEGDWGWANQKTSLSGMIYPAPGPGSEYPWTGNPNDTFAVRTTWDASARARVGFLVNPSVMLYGTGGAAWMHIESTSTCDTATYMRLIGFCSAGQLSPSIITDATTKLGWTAGAGVEARIWSHWLARAEYRYADFGAVHNIDTRTSTSSPTFTDVFSYDLRLRTHTVTFGIAYLFGDAPTLPGAPILRAPIDQAPAADVSWTGLYLGVGAGLRADQSRGTVTSDTDIIGGAPINRLAGFFGCADVPCTLGEPFNGFSAKIAPYFGYDWQIARQWVAGVEGDWAWADHTTTLTGMIYPMQIPNSLGNAYFTGNVNDNFSIRTTWDASARGRLGYLVTPTMLLYATGGAAWLHVESTSTCNTISSQNSQCPAGFIDRADIADSTTKLGWTVGGGFEAALGGRWFARAEYRYSDYGTISNTDTRNCIAAICATIGGESTIIGYDVKVRTHTALLGLAYKFNWDRPITARD